MSARADEILAAALSLPPTDRAALVDAILASFDPPVGAAHDARWAAEVEGRLAAFRHGMLTAAPAAEVFARIDRREQP